MSGARVYVGISDHDAEHYATTDADGRYTASLPRANRRYTLSVSADAQTGLASAHYGNVPCGYATPVINVQRHVAGIDLALPKGYSITLGARSSAGTPTRMNVTLAVYLPAHSTWCDVTEPDRLILELPDYLFRTVLYAAGTYRVRAVGLQEGQYPETWYPSALTGTSGSPVVLDRDLTGADAKIVTLPAQTYTISGRIQVSEVGEVPTIQVVMLDGGRVEVVAGGYPQDWSTNTYSFAVWPGTYKVRIAPGSSDRKQDFYYHPDGAATFDAGQTVTVTNTNVTGINIVKK